MRRSIIVSEALTASDKVDYSHKVSIHSVDEFGLPDKLQAFGILFQKRGSIFIPTE